MDRRKVGIIAVLLVLCSAIGLLTTHALVLERDSKGTEFWLTFPGNGIPSQDLSLFITGEVATTGTVAMPGLGFSENFSVTPGSVTTVKLPPNAEISAAASANDTISNKGILVTAQNEVSVYGLNRVQFTTDAYLGLPTDILGTEYIVLGYKNTLPGTQFAMVATADATSVTITPTVTTGARTAGAPYSLTLNRGQTYQLANRTENLGDLSGTVITANKPIAVFGGHQCAYIPNSTTQACDYLVEQLPPTETWGKSFVTVPLATRKNGDTFRFLAAVNNTQVRVNNNLVATMNRGQLHEMILTTPSQIDSTQPILVAQYSNGSTFDGVTSDPFMMLIPPSEQFLGRYTVTTPATGFASNFINVVAPNEAVGSIVIDGQTIPASSFAKIGESGFSGSQVTIRLGTHNLSGPLPFGIFVYGFDAFDSYGYPGGESLAPIVRVTSLALAPKTSTGSARTQHCVTATISDQNNSPVEGVRIDFRVTGANTASGFANSDSRGQAQFCYTGQNGGEDTIRASVGNIADTASRIWSQCEPRVNVILANGKQSFDLGPVAAMREVAANSPVDSFTLENFGCLPVSVKLQRTGADVTSGKISNPDDSAIFSLLAVGSSGTETIVPISPGSPPLQLPSGQTLTFRLRFHPLIPVLSGKTSSLFANQAIPDVITSQLIITPENGTPQIINVTARVGTPVQLIHPTDSRLQPLIVFTRTALEYTVECSVHDPNLDVNLARYQFLDQSDRPIGLPADVDLTQPIAGRGLVRGQSFTIIQKFAGSLQSNIAKVQVTIFDRETTVSSARTALGTAEPAVANVSAASYLATGLASESMVAAFGANLASDVQVASTVPLPTTLNGTSVRVRDGAGVERPAPLFFVSPGQINYQIPPGTRVGAGTVSVMRGDQAVAREVVQVAASAPAMFSANSNGQGVAAAVALRVSANGSQQFDPVARFDQSRNQFVPLPLNFGSSGDQLYLVLFGAGFRYRNPQSQISARIGGVDVQVAYAGPQGSFVGLDQVNIPLPRSLAGRGEVDVILFIDGRPSNAVKINLGGTGSLTSLDEWVAARNEAANRAVMANRVSENGSPPILRLPTIKLPAQTQNFSQRVATGQKE